MTDPPATPEPRQTSVRPDDADAGIPRWVVIAGTIIALLIAMFVIVWLVGGGDHSPGRHGMWSSVADVRVATRASLLVP